MFENIVLVAILKLFTFPERKYLHKYSTLTHTPLSVLIISTHPPEYHTTSKTFHKTFHPKRFPSRLN